MAARPHKYVRREGSKGDWKYFYKMPDGSIQAQEGEKQESGKLDHVRRLVFSKVKGHHDMSVEDIANHVGVDRKKVYNMITNLRRKGELEGIGHGYSDEELKEAHGEESKGEPKKEDRRAKVESAKKEIQDKNQKELESSHAEELGRKAFQNGKQSVPSQDKDLMQLISENPNKEVGASMHILDAWIKGWHKANLAAPVEEKKPEETPKSEFGRFETYIKTAKRLVEEFKQFPDKAENFEERIRKQAASLTLGPRVKPEERKQADAALLKIRDIADEFKKKNIKDKDSGPKTSHEWAKHHMEEAKKHVANKNFEEADKHIKESEKHLAKMNEETKKKEDENKIQSIKDFEKYVWGFYGPNEVHGDFFDHKLTQKEVKDAVAAVIKERGDKFEGDSIDREAVRDYLLEKKQSGSSKEEDVNKMSEDVKREDMKSSEKNSEPTKKDTTHEELQRLSKELAGMGGPDFGEIKKKSMFYIEHDGLKKSASLVVDFSLPAIKGKGSISENLYKSEMITQIRTLQKSRV